jgi:DNA-binding NtrC family response regulator
MDDNKMNTKENRLRMAAAGYRTVTKNRRKSKAEPNLTYEMKLEAAKNALGLTGGHRRKASEMLGISESTVYRSIREMHGE